MTAQRMTAADARRQVTNLMPDMVARLRDLVRIPSITFQAYPREPGREAAEVVAGQLRSLGTLDVQLVDLSDGPPTVFASRPAPPDAPTVLLYAHYDVQPVGDMAEWSSPPFALTERDGRLYGRGAADIAGSLVLCHRFWERMSQCPSSTSRCVPASSICWTAFAGTTTWGSS